MRGQPVGAALAQSLQIGLMDRIYGVEPMNKRARYNCPIQSRAT